MTRGDRFHGPPHTEKRRNAGAAVTLGIINENLHFPSLVSINKLGVTYLQTTLIDSSSVIASPCYNMAMSTNEQKGLDHRYILLYNPSIHIYSNLSIFQIFIV